MADPVVVGVDGSGRSLRALVWAASDAALHQWPLLIAHVLPAWQLDIPLVPGRFQGKSRKGAEILAEAAAIARESHPDLEVETGQLSGSPAELFRSASERASRIVLGARGEGGFGNLLMGSVSLQVAGHAASPVVVVGELVSGYRRILVGVDGSPDSTSALEFAFEEAALRGDRIQALRAWSVPVPSEGEPNPAEAEQQARRGLDEQVEEFRHRYPAVEVEKTLVHGQAAPELIYASDRADLAVVGSRGKGGFHGLALGSVSHALLHYGACPVAVVRAGPRPADTERSG